jgi:hypothetical protein
MPLFDCERQAPAASKTAHPGPLTIALDVAIGTTGVAGDGWTDHIHTKHPTLHGRFAEQLDGCASFYRHADFVIIEGAAFSKARFAGMDQLSRCGGWSATTCGSAASRTRSCRRTSASDT